MKRVLLILSLFCASIGFSAQVYWTAYNLDSSLINGTAYLIQKDSTVDVDFIASVLENEGIPAGNHDGYTAWFNSEVFDGGSYGGYLEQSDGTLEVPSSVSGDHWFMVVISEDGTTFAICEELNGILVAEVINAEFDVFGTDGYWTTGTIASGDTPDDPNVPEPTALALLALGVAGVALRRRVA